MAEIGLLVGRDRTFSDAILARVNARPEPVTAEYITVGGVRMAAPPGYAVILDRIAHKVPFYLSYLKNAAACGTVVVNDPFWQLNDDHFLAVAMAKRLDVPVVKTLLVPNREHVAGVVPESLRNRMETLDWVGAMAYLGFPLVMRPNAGDWDSRAVLVHSAEELLACWNSSGVNQYILQETVMTNRFARCLVIGESVRILPWPAPEVYGLDSVPPGTTTASMLTTEEADRLADWAKQLSTALGHTLNAVDFALTDAGPVAVSLTANDPDLSPARLGPEPFAWMVNRVTEFLVRQALPFVIDAATGEPMAARDRQQKYRWDAPASAPASAPAIDPHQPA